MGAEGAIQQRAVGCTHAGGAARSPRRFILCLCLAVASALLFALASANPSLAVRGHEFAGAFGWGVSDASGKLQRCKSKESCQAGLPGSGEGQFHAPDGIAVNEATNQVYVVDKANDRVEIFNASGSEFKGEFDGSGTHLNEGQEAGSAGKPEEVKTGRFDEPEEIAVDNDPSSPSFQDVYVVDTRGHAAKTTAPAVVDKFSPTGKYIGQITRNPDGEPFSEDGFREIFGVSVDQSGQVWVEEQNFGSSPDGSSPDGAANYTNAVANEWIAFRSTRVGGVSSASAPGFAVDSEDNLYVHNTFGSGDRLAKFSTGEEEAGQAKLISPELDEEAPTGVAVELSSNNVYVSHASNVHRLNTSGVSREHPNGVSLETLREEAPGGSSFTGVAVDEATLTVYLADAKANRVDVFAPEAPGPPSIEAGSTAVSEVSDQSASFSAEVNPRSEPGEAPTSYRFEYGPCPSAGACPSSPYPEHVPVPEGTLAPNYEPDLVGAHPQDLLAHTLYHVRVGASNSHGEATPGEELIFRTQTSGTTPLPDGRHWELVSPPQKHGAILRSIEAGGLIQAAGSGDAFSYLANAPTEADPAGFSETVQILSRRGAFTWESEDISTPHEASVGITFKPGPGEYHFFSEDLSTAILHPAGPFTQAISPQASERTSFLRTDFPPGDPSHPCSSSCYRPLVSGCPGEGGACPAAVQEVANVPEGTKFGEEETCREACGPYFLGASPDASHVVLAAKVPLSEEAPERKQGEEGVSLYEWVAGKLSLVSILPDGQPAKPGSKPGLGFVSEAKSIRIARNAISADGGRVVWSEASGAHHLYLRDMVKGQTIELDVPEAGCTAKCKGTAHPVFQGASVDDSRIFFTDSQPLTQLSGNSDLYECAIEEAEGEPACKLSDLTPPHEGQEGAGVLGLAVGAAEDGSAIYFTANGKLGEGKSARGEEAVAGNCKGNTSGSHESETAAESCNLYVHSDGQTRLVAVLSGADFPDWSLRGGGLSGLSARVSPNGRYLAFMSRRSLSGYDNRDATSARPDQEVFLYENLANGGAGALVCASCNPSGGRPRGVQYKKIDVEEGGLAGGANVWPATAWIAASIPGWTAISPTEGFALHQSRYLSNAGRLFFNAEDSLVPQDSNKTEDVYEYEPSGVGDCSEEKSTFGVASGGCVSLISSGTSREESAFLDASESGDDVFFLTYARLLPSQDLDSSLDVYDAHACSASSPCLPEPPPPQPACEGDSCQSPGAAPEVQTPGSLSFQGPGNPAPPAAAILKPKTPAQIKAEKLKKALRSCHKQKRKRKRSSCEAKARKLYGAHQAKKAKAKGSSRGKR